MPALVVGFTAAVESGRPALVIAGTVLFVLDVCGCVVVGRHLQASTRPRRGTRPGR